MKNTVKRKKCIGPGEAAHGDVWNCGTSPGRHSPCCISVNLVNKKLGEKTNVFSLSFFILGAYWTPLL